MKTKIIIIALLFLAIGINAQLFDKLKKQVEGKVGTKKLSFTEDEAAKALKEALTNGAGIASGLASKTDGFFGNPEIKIPFPENAKKVESAIRKAGFNSLADNVVLSINRAAEDASKVSKDILVDAIKKLTINDAINIAKGEDNAGTNYLRKTSTDNLSNAFKPIIENSLNKVDATKYWKEAIDVYNKIPFVKKENADLTDYVNTKALNGLFKLIEKEEKEIRKDPIKQTTDLLKKVFGK